MTRRHLTVLVVVIWSIAALGTAPGIDLSVTNAHQAAQTVSLRDVEVRGDLIEGVVANHSSHVVRDIGLLVRYTWTWNHERHPGEQNPGRAAFYPIAGPVPPGASIPFSYRTSEPLPPRSDGHFTPSVVVVAYTEAVEGTAANR
jgi:hypothetical protein